MSEQLIALAEQSAENDLAFLIKAKEDAKGRMKQNMTPENVAAFKKAKEAVEEELARLKQKGQPGENSVRVFKTQLDAVAYLQDAGYTVSKSTLNRAVKARKIPRNAQGYYEESALLAYAAANLTPTAQAENSVLASATAGKLSADAKLKEYQAERTRMKMEKEQGLLISRAAHEDDLAARALFFKSEIESFIVRKGGDLIALVEGKEELLQELYHWWNRETEDWMDAWDSDREFLAKEEDESAPMFPVRPVDDED
ncbi:hypothetical protein [Bilophila wadsworthia]|uniref:hypothetical protein n=1 Tax=Bilophila wadsworthia TaxID=35833 RepID=UPI003AB0534A